MLFVLKVPPLLVLLAMGMAGMVQAEVFFSETFPVTEKNLIFRNWVQSLAREDYGSFNLSQGQRFWSAKEDIGLQTLNDTHFYAVSAKLNAPVSNADRDLVFQFTVKNEQILRCGGSYWKLLGCDVDQEKFSSESPYLVMFGPDICGPGNRKLQVILNKRGNNHQLSKHIKYPLDKLTHQYTMIIRPNNTFDILIDNRRVHQGQIDQDFGILPPMKIDDPDATKPELWDDKEYIIDPEAKKPDDWVDEKYVQDPDAAKPDDWDDETDGSWEPPLIDNPVYQGPWEPKRIKNPNYDGEWAPPQIDNPAYIPDPELYIFPEICAVGLEIWQVEAGSIFDNLLLTDDADYAKKEGEKLWRPRNERERDLVDEEERLNEELEKNSDDTMDDEMLENFKKMTRGEPIDLPNTGGAAGDDPFPTDPLYEALGKEVKWGMEDLSNDEQELNEDMDEFLEGKIPGPSFDGDSRDEAQRANKEEL